MYVLNTSGWQILKKAAKKFPKKYAADRGEGRILCLLHSPHKYYSFKYKLICMLCEFPTQ